MPEPPLPPTDARPNPKSRSVRSLVSSAIGLVAVAALAGVLYQRRTELLHALDVDAGSLALLAALVLAAQAQRAFEFQFMLSRLGVKERYRDSLLLTGATQLLNYLPFSAGSVARAVALRRRHALSYPAYVSALMVAALVSASVSGAAGLVASLTLATPSVQLALLFGATLVGACVTLSLVTFKMPVGKSAVHLALKRFEQGSVLMRSSRSVAVLAVTSSTKLLLSVGRLAVCYWAFGETPTLPALVLLGSAGVITSLVNLTPGNLGLRELALGALTAALGGSLEHGVAAASLERAATLASTLLIGLPGLGYLQRSVRQSS